MSDLEPQRPTPDDHDDSRKGVMWFFRHVFTELRPGEGRVASLLMGAVFFFLAALYMLKVAREAKVLADRGFLGLHGPQLKATARGFQALILTLVVIPAYSRVSARLPRRGLMIGMVLFYVLNIEIFHLLSVLQIPNLGFYFYVWVGIFNVSIMAQFWSYANDVYTPQAGRRIFPLIMLGASFGGVAGVLLDRVIKDFRYFQLHPYSPLQVTALLLLTGLFLFLVADRSVEEHTPSSTDTRGRLQLGNGLMRVLSSPYIRLIGLSLVFLNLVNATGEYILDNFIMDYAHQTASLQALEGTEAWRLAQRLAIGNAYNTFYLAVNLLTLVLQAFVTSRIIRRVGTVGALFVLPVVAFGAYSLVLLGGGYLAFRIVKILENASDYSINNTVQQLLWAPTTREEKYQAKQAADTIFYRLGDLLHSILIWVGTTVFALTPHDFAFVNVVLSILWIVLILALAREYKNTVRRHPVLSPQDPCRATQVSG